MKKWFKGINTLEELKAEFKKLAMKHHPDLGGSTEDMQEINNEYDILSKVLPSQNKTTSQADNTNNAERFRDILMAIIHLNGLEIEICGNWIWVSGNTREHKTTLKSNGFMWASKKEMWYWRAEEYSSHGKKNTTMADIRTKYGSEKVSGGWTPSLA